MRYLIPLVLLASMTLAGCETVSPLRRDYNHGDLRETRLGDAMLTVKQGYNVRQLVYVGRDGDSVVCEDVTYYRGFHQQTRQYRFPVGNSGKASIPGATLNILHADARAIRYEVLRPE